MTRFMKSALKYAGKYIKAHRQYVHILCKKVVDCDRGFAFKCRMMRKR